MKALLSKSHWIINNFLIALINYCSFVKTILFDIFFAVKFIEINDYVPAGVAFFRFDVKEAFGFSFQDFIADI